MALCIASTKTVNQIQNALTYLVHIGHVPQLRYTTRLCKHFNKIDDLSPKESNCIPGNIHRGGKRRRRPMREL